MERAPDRGRAWRDRITPVLERLGHEWYNPCEEELDLLSDEERRHFGEWKATADDRFLPMMRRIIDHDLTALEDSDYVICYWDEHAQWSGGTPSEVTVARLWGMPVYLVRAMPLVDVSSWVQGCASEIFDSIEALGAFLGDPDATVNAG